MIINPFRFFKDLLLNLYPAEVGFSLRKINIGYTGDCITVRRSSDNTTLGIGFDGTELDVASLEAFCNPNAVVYTSDFTAGNEDLSEINGIGTDGETVAGVSDCYKFELSGGLAIHQAIGNLPEDGQQYTVSFDYYIPSTNAKTDGIAILPALGGGAQFVYGVDQWKSVTIDLEVPVGALPRFRFRPSEGININIDADGDIFYLKNVVVTQLTSDGYVTTWYDQSGNGNNATQNIASSQPKIVSSGSVILENGKPAIEAIGISNALSLPFTGAAQMTTVAVSRMYDISSNRYITDSASGRYIVGTFGGTGKYTAFRSTQLSGDTAQATQASLYFATFDGVNSTITNDGGTTYTGDAGTSTFAELRLMTGLGGFNGNVQEIIIYKSDQSSNRTNIEDNINNFYNIY